MDTTGIYTIASVVPDIDQFMTYFPIPGYGIVPVNSFLIHGNEPVLVDTNLKMLEYQFIASLEKIINPTEIKWVWLTHTDPDHLGNLQRVLNLLVNARLVTTYIGMGKLALHQLPIDKVYLLNPGQVLSAGDRQLMCIVPPTYDAPETTGILDIKSSTCFTADCFGAVLKEPAERASAISSSILREGLKTWATIDAPWLIDIDRDKFGKKISAFRNFNVQNILSSHLPAAHNMTDTLLEYLSEACKAPPFEGPDQTAMEKIMLW